MIYTFGVFRKLVFVTFIMALTSNAQTNITIGAKAPVIHITDWIDNTPKDKNLSGKYVVLEFWATWCGPCIAAVPHMNELQKEFTQNDLYFISMTYESVEKAQRILKRVSFNSMVVTDQTKATQVQFGDGKKGLTQYPLTVLIDNKGIIQWIGAPKKLTKEILKNFTSGSEINAVDTKEKVKDEKEAKDFTTLFKDKELDYYFQLTTDNDKGIEFSKQSINTSIIVLSAASLEDIYTQIFDRDPSSIRIPDDLRNQQFKLVYKNTRDKENSLQMLEKVLLEKLQLQKRTLTEQKASYLVFISDKTLLEETLETRFSAKSDADDKIVFTAYTIQDMLREINKIFSEDFRYEESIQTKFDFIIATSSKKAMLSSLQSYGFNAKEETIEMMVTVLEKKK